MFLAGWDANLKPENPHSRGKYSWCPEFSLILVWTTDITAAQKQGQYHEGSTWSERWPYLPQLPCPPIIPLLLESQPYVGHRFRLMRGGGGGCFTLEGDPGMREERPILSTSRPAIKNFRSLLPSFVYHPTPHADPIWNRGQFRCSIILRYPVFSEKTLSTTPFNRIYFFNVLDSPLRIPTARDNGM